MPDPDPNPGVAEATASVTVKLPEFWRNDPNMWFAQAEAQFNLARVTKDETKFWVIIAKIDQTVISHVWDLVSNPPAEDKYGAVKERLISRFALSAQARLEQLLGSCDLGDFRPTHLLARMNEIATGLNVDDNLMKMLFMQRMPANIRAVLSISDGSLAKLAEMADQMIDSSSGNVAAVSTPAKDQSAVNAVGTIPSSSNQAADLAYLKDEIGLLTAEIRRLKIEQPRNRSRFTSRSARTTNDTICWFHRNFGNRADHCREPCEFNRPKN